LFLISHHNLPARTLARPRLTGLGCISIAIVLLAAIATPAVAQNSTVTEIYNSGIVSLGPDETLQLTIVNNNNVPDPALPPVPASAELCSIVAQFLDGSGTTLQKQEQTLQPGQNLSLSVSGQQTVQARVDVSPGTSSGFARAIADQCAVSTEILNTSSNEPVLFPGLRASRVPTSLQECKSQCSKDCSARCKKVAGCRSFCTDACKDDCESEFSGS
jgi:hypothetical protein